MNNIIIKIMGGSHSKNKEDPHEFSDNLYHENIFPWIFNPAQSQHSTDNPALHPDFNSSLWSLNDDKLLDTNLPRMSNNEMQLRYVNKAHIHSRFKESKIFPVERTLSSLPGFSFLYNPHQDFITESSCCICFRDYYDGVMMQMLPCDHIIHFNCFQDWYHKSPTCPLCRTDFISY
jgi:hypothetical protein